MRDHKKILKIGILSLFFVFIIIYGFFASRDVIFGVKIKNVNIMNGTKVSDSIYHITGNARNAVNIYLNGREISIDKEGNFDETIALSLGYNIVEIRARDKFGNEDKKDYQLIYKQE